MQRQIPSGWALSCTPPTLAPTLAALSVNLQPPQVEASSGSIAVRKDGRWPTQARFWLERGCSDLLNSVIPTGTDRRERDDLRSGGTLCLMFASDGWISSQNGRHETRMSGRKTLFSVELPHSSQNRLEWTTRPAPFLKRLSRV